MTKRISLLPDVCLAFLFYLMYCLPPICTVYQPNLRPKSDADILRDAKMEAMGMPLQDDSPRRTNHERTQMATDELVRAYCNEACKYATDLPFFIGDGAIQEENAQVGLFSSRVCAATGNEGYLKVYTIYHMYIGMSVGY